MIAVVSSPSSPSRPSALASPRSQRPCCLALRRTLIFVGALTLGALMRVKRDGGLVQILTSHRKTSRLSTATTRRNGGNDHHHKSTNKKNRVMRPQERKQNLAKLATCLQDKTVLFVGNSNMRSLYFTVHAILQAKERAQRGFHWMNRERQKQLCQKESHWPPQPSCQTVAETTNTTLINTWTQRIDHLPDLFERFLFNTTTTPPPDIVLLNIGLDHVATDVAQQWENIIEWTWPTLVRQWKKYYQPESSDKHHHSLSSSHRHHKQQQQRKRLVITPVYHFNETLAQNKKMSNRRIDSLNAYLQNKIWREQWINVTQTETKTTTQPKTTPEWDPENQKPPQEPPTWLVWHEEPADIAHQALHGKNGLGMSDWVHPNNEAMLAIAAELANVVCE